MAVEAVATTTDTFGRVLRDLRISVTDRCNFRCPYCMPAEIYGATYAFLPKAEILTFEEITQLARIFVGLGVRKLRLTGGEPLLRRDLPLLVRMLASIEGVEDLALTTNGRLLPRLAAELKSAGLHRLTISIDSLDDEVFKVMSGDRAGVRSALDGIEAAERAGFGPLKLNCVVQRGVNDHTILDLARHFKGRGHILRFIEYMDVGTLNQWNLADLVPAEEIAERIGADTSLRRAAPNYAGEVATRYVYADGEGEIGIIASVSAPFCGSCTRARLTTDGRLLTCLFAATGTDLRGPLRDGASDAELRDFITGIWTRRSDRYSEERAARIDESGAVRSGRKLEMYQLGG